MLTPAATLFIVLNFFGYEKTRYVHVLRAPLIIFIEFSGSLRREKPFPNLFFSRKLSGFQFSRPFNRSWVLGKYLCVHYHKKILRELI